MKKSTRFYPDLDVDDAGTGIVSQAGAVLLAETAKAVGLPAALSTGDCVSILHADARHRTCRSLGPTGVFPSRVSIATKSPAQKRKILIQKYGDGA